MSFLVKHLGIADYESTYQAMRDFTQQRDGDTPDEIWILEHPPVFTLGLAGDAGNLHSPSNQIPLIQVDRGGEITYHGPGQIVVYLLLDLRRLGIFVKELVSRIEQALINTLADFGIRAERHAGAPGITLLTRVQYKQSIEVPRLPHWVSRSPRGAHIMGLP